jgi:hypothetical protein
LIGVIFFDASWKVVLLNEVRGTSFHE